MAERDPADGVVFFATAVEFRSWLADNHAVVTEQWVGFWKKATGVPSITWPESVDQALCFGWIDGLRKSIDEDRYKIRFTPRRPGSYWSQVNLRRAAELIELGSMQPAGLAAYEARDADRDDRYSFERENPALSEELEREFRAHPEAWSFFESQPPGYRRVATHWVISAKREETRARRLRTLIEDSAAGLRIKELRR